MPDYSLTKNRTFQWMIIILILVALAGAYRYFSVRASTKMNAPQNSLNTSGLIGLWSFDGADISGTTAYDRSGSGNNGTLTNGPVPILGKVGQGLKFDGTIVQSVNSLANSTTIANLTQSSVAFWIYPQRSGSQSSIFSIIGADAGGNGPFTGGGFLVSGDTAYNTQKIRFIVDGSTTDMITYSSTLLTLNAWTHVVVVWDGSLTAANVKFYFNGILSGTTGSNGAGSYVAGSGRFFMGRYNTGTVKFDGRLDDVRVYDRALSAGEVASLYNSGANTKINASENSMNTSGLVGQWSFDGADISGTTTAYDRSGSGNNGTLTNGPVPILGKVGQGLKFDGTNDYVTMGAPSALNLTGAMSISAWIYPTGWGMNNRGRIVDKDSNVATGYIFAIDNITTTSGIGFMTDGAVSPTSGFFVANCITLNKWQHVAVTMTASKVVTIYVNGVSVGTPPTFTNFPGSGANNFVIGGRTTANDRNFAGTIDEVRVYNRAISAGEVTSLYNMGVGTKLTP